MRRTDRTLNDYEMQHNEEVGLFTRPSNMVFNMGLQSAVFVLERGERLSPEGRRHLIESLKKNIAQSEGVYPLQVLEQSNTKVLEIL